MNRILVTGATGYIGQAILDASQKLEMGADIKWFGVSRSKPQAVNGWHAFQGDIFDPELPKLLMEIQPNVIIHTVAAPKTAPLEAQLKTNVLGTEYLLQSILESQIKTKVIVIGSAAEYGLREGPIDEDAPVNPEGDYGVAKVAQTYTALNYGKRYHIPVVVGRLFNVYGQTQTTLSVAALASQIAKQEQRPVQYPKIKAYNLQSKRDFIHIDDVIISIMALAEFGQSGEIYNIGSGEALSLETILEQLLSQSRLRTVDIMKTGEQIINSSQADIKKITRDTRWQTKVSLADGLNKELDYWREEHQLLAI